MSYKFEELKGKNYVVHVPTKELALQVEKILGDFLSGEFTENNWECYKENTCYNLKQRGFGYVSFYRNTWKYTIISAEDFIRDNIVEKPKTFQVDGTPNLIKAFMQELKDLGYTFPNYDRIIPAYTRAYCNNQNVYNNDKIGKKEHFINIFSPSKDSNQSMHQGNYYKLPLEWDTALKYARESINSPYWKIQEELPVISGYKPEREPDGIKYGCQSYKIEELQVIERLLKNPVNAILKIGETDIDLKLIQKLIKYIE